MGNKRLDRLTQTLTHTRALTLAYSKGRVSESVAVRDGTRRSGVAGVTKHCQEVSGHAALEWASRDIFYLHNDNASYSADDDDDDDDYTPAITQTHPSAQ